MITINKPDYYDPRLIKSILDAIVCRPRVLCITPSHVQQERTSVFFRKRQNTGRGADCLNGELSRTNVTNVSECFRHTIRNVTF